MIYYYDTDFIKAIEEIDNECNFAICSFMIIKLWEMM